jgi:hypothetical protein
MAAFNHKPVMDHRFTRGGFDRMQGMAGDTAANTAALLNERAQLLLKTLVERYMPLTDRSWLTMPPRANAFPSLMSFTPRFLLACPLFTAC